MRTYNIMVVGATGLVGRTLLKVLEERKFPVGKLMLLASEKSHGQHITFGGRSYAVETLSETAFQEDMDMAFYSRRCDQREVCAFGSRKRHRSRGQQLHFSHGP